MPFEARMLIEALVLVENICFLAARRGLGLKTDRRCWTNAEVSPRSPRKNVSHGWGRAGARAKAKPRSWQASQGPPGWELAMGCEAVTPRSGRGHPKASACSAPVRGPACTCALCHPSIP